MHYFVLLAPLVASLVSAQAGTQDGITSEDPIICPANKGAFCCDSFGTPRSATAGIDCFPISNAGHYSACARGANANLCCQTFGIEKGLAVGAGCEKAPAPL